MPPPLRHIYSQLFITPPLPTNDCSGKTLIVTGANVGLGKEAARHYVRLNAALVIIACRSLEKGEAAKRDIEATTSRKGVVEVWVLDLADYESVKQFAARAEGLKRIDALVENAGVVAQKYVEVGGHESSITVNVISTFLLALLILPKLQESAKRFSITPHIAIISSEAHGYCRFEERKAVSIFQALKNEEKYDPSEQYHVGKLLEVLVVREIAREHPDLEVTINAASPGWCWSELMRDEPKSMMVGIAQRILCRSTEAGSRTVVDAGLHGSNSHGKFLVNCEVEPCSQLVEGLEGPELQRRAWKELGQELELIHPGILKVLDA